LSAGCGGDATRNLAAVSRRPQRWISFAAGVAVIAVLFAGCADDEENVAATAFANLEAVGPTYQLAVTDSNVFRTCVTAAAADRATLQGCVDNGSDAISGPATIAALVANRVEPLRGQHDDRSVACVAAADRAIAELQAWHDAAATWKAGFDADPGAAPDPALATTIGDRQHDAEAAWTDMRAACSADTSASSG
jgi:hypothetical protein